MERCIRPWGTYKILYDTDNYKIKEITVDKGKRLSYQSHKLRDELWYILSGDAQVILDDKAFDLTAGLSIKIRAKQKHRIHNTGSLPLIFIEIQTGSYFGEDDIIRFEDDYGRC